MAKKAASFAAVLRQELDEPVTMTHGRRGQFDVLVDGDVVISRKGGLIAKLIGRPWPSQEEVIAAVKRHL